MATDSTAPEQTKRLGEMLLEAGVITEGQLEEALEKKKAEGGFVGKILMDLRYIDEHTLTNFLVKQFKIPHISLLDYEIADEVVKMVPRELCVQYNLIPIDKLGKILTIAMVDPLDTEAMTKVREVCPDVRIKPILCTFQHFEHVLRKAYQDQPAEKNDKPEKTPEELTMESFGLTPKSDKDRKKPAEPKTSAAPMPVSGPALPPSADEILGLVDKTIRAAMDEAVATLAFHLRDVVAAGNGELPVAPLQLAERMRQAISEASETAGGALLQDVRKALEDAEQPASELSALQLGQILEHSMRGALQQTTAEVIEEAARALANRGR